MSGCGRRGFSRRGALAALGAAVVCGCSENSATGRRQLVVVGEEQMAELAAQSWIDLKRQTRPVADPRVQARLDRIGRRLADASGLTGLDWEFVVFDSPEVNAFVLPGGKVGFYKGLMELTRSDDEVASVMGHEIGHVSARHAAERLTQQIGVQAVASLAAAVVSGSEEFGQYADEAAGALGMGLTVGLVLPYSRKHELEADAVGVRLTDLAGYDPAGAVSFWRRMIAVGSDRPRPPEALSTHPADARRLELLQAEIARLPA